MLDIDVVMLILLLVVLVVFPLGWCTPLRMYTITKEEFEE